MEDANGAAILSVVLAVAETCASVTPDLARMRAIHMTGNWGGNVQGIQTLAVRIGAIHVSEHHAGDGEPVQRRQFLAGDADQ